MKSIILLLLLVFSAPTIFAESLFEPRLVNYDIEEQVADDPERILPKGETYTTAVDVILWKYWPDTVSYYHGPGFWVDTYLEYRPLETLSVNAKVLFANGSSSFGYNASAGSRPFLGVTWEPKISENWNFMVRFFDLDRESLGAGLFFQDREMSGAYFSINRGNWFFDLRLPGTSVLNLSGDLYSAEFFRRSSVNDIGLHVFYVQQGIAFVPSTSNPNTVEDVTFNLNPVTSLFMRSRDNSLMKYNFEVAARDDQLAYMAALGMQRRFQCVFCYDIFFQYRYYDEDIVGLFGGQASIEYVPYTLQFRDFHNAINIFRIRGESQSYSANVNFKINFNDTYAWESMNEVGRIEYTGLTSTDDFIWYRQSFNYCPVVDRRRTCLKFFVANKILQVSGLQRGFGSNSNIFRKADVFGFEAIMLF